MNKGDTTITCLASFVDAVRFDTLPEAVVHETKRLLLDSIGCALAGVDSEKGKWGLEFGLANLAGPAQATVIGVGERLSSSGAAFVNAELINGLDYDAGMTPGHVSPFVIPASLAVAEQNHASGRDLITACAVAHELSHRIGANLGTFRDIVNDKVTFPLVSGYSFSIFGGTAAVAKLESFTKEQSAHALGLAGHMAPMQAHTSMMKNLPTTTAKYLMAGWVSQAEITAAYLARAGHRGDVHILDGDWGYWRFAGASRWDAEAALAGLGDEWRFQETARYKIYPCCRIMHGALDCLDAIVKTNELHPGEIESIRAFLEASCVEPVFSTREIERQVDAQFSIAYNLAVMAFGIKPGVQWQQRETMHDPEIRQFMNKITFETHPQYVEALKKNAQSRISRLEVSARGKLFVEEKEIAKGAPSQDPSTYMTDGDLVVKFQENAGAILGRQNAETVSQQLMELERASDLSKVMQALCR